MSARLLALVVEGHEAAVLTAMPTLATIAHAKRATVRLAYLRSFPPPRRDQIGRIVVSEAREMSRITHTVVESFTWAARRAGDLDLEVVVRFGRAQREALIETEVFAPDFVGLVATRTPRWSTWMLRRRLTAHTRARLIVLEAPSSASLSWRTATPAAVRF